MKFAIFILSLILSVSFGFNAGRFRMSIVRNCACSHPETLIAKPPLCVEKKIPLLEAVKQEAAQSVQGKIDVAMSKLEGTLQRYLRQEMVIQTMLMLVLVSKIINN